MKRKKKTVSMENAIESSEQNGLEEWGNFFFESVDEFLLFISGYHDLQQNPPSRVEVEYSKEEWIVEIASVQAGIVSGLAALIPFRFRIPALGLEYLINNRLHAEMITKISLKRDKKLEPKDFLICLSATGTTSLEDVMTKEKMEIFLNQVKKLISKSLLKTYSQDFFDLITVKTLSTIPLMDSVLSGVFTYFETKNIAKNTSDFLEGKHNAVYYAENI